MKTSIAIIIALLAGCSSYDEEKCESAKKQFDDAKLRNYYLTTLKDAKWVDVSHLQEPSYGDVEEARLLVNKYCVK